MNDRPTHPQVSHDALVARAFGELGAQMEQLSQTRQTVLAPYRDWPDTRRMGPPFDFGFRDRPTGMSAIRDLVTTGWGPCGVFGAAFRASAQWDHLLLDYAAGRLCGLDMQGSRTEVEKAYEALAEALDAADAAMRAWASRAPTSTAPIGKLIGDSISSSWRTSCASRERAAGARLAR